MLYFIYIKKKKKKKKKKIKRFVFIKTKIQKQQKILVETLGIFSMCYILRIIFWIQYLLNVENFKYLFSYI